MSEENKCKIIKNCEHHTPSKMCSLFTVNPKFKGVCKYFNNYACKSKVAILNAMVLELKEMGFVISKEVIEELESKV